MGTMGGMSAVIAGGPAVYALMPPLGCVLCHAWRFLVSAKIPANCNLEFTNDLELTVFVPAWGAWQSKYSSEEEA